MSTTPDVGDVVAACEPVDVSPVELSAADLRTTAPPHLREVKVALTAAGRHPTALVADADFSGSDAAECRVTAVETSPAGDEFDRLRELVEAASFLGAGTLRLSLHGSVSPEVEQGLRALKERANRAGVTLRVVD